MFSLKDLFNFIPALITGIVSLVNVFKKDKPEPQPEPEIIPEFPELEEPQPEIQPEPQPQPETAKTPVFVGHGSNWEPQTPTPKPTTANINELYKNVPEEERQEFMIDVYEMCKRLNLDFKHISCIMHLESKMQTIAVNPFTRATGLIQFMPATAKELGVDTYTLSKMTYSDQLFWVEKYFKKYAEKTLRRASLSFVDTYLLVFYPAAIIWPNGKQFPDKVKQVNKIYVKNGEMTKDTINDFLLNRYSKYLT